MRVVHPKSDTMSGWSDKETVALVYAVPPEIEVSFQNVKTSSKYITIMGSAFDYVNDSANSITLVATGSPPASAVVLEASRTKLVIRIQKIAKTNV